MRFWFLLCALLGLMPLGGKAHARAAYKMAPSMIASAEAIAIVNVTNVEQTAIKGRTWTYNEKATAQIEATLKGNLPSEVMLYGRENFRCAQARFKVGHQIVFLDRDAELWTGNNWQLSVRPIENNQVAWSNSKLRPQESVPLYQAVEEIRAIIQEQEKAPIFHLNGSAADAKWTLKVGTEEKFVAANFDELARIFHQLPLGAKVEHFSSCLRIAGEIYPQQRQWQQLQRTARSAGVNLVIHPAG